MVEYQLDDVKNVDFISDSTFFSVLFFISHTLRCNMAGCGRFFHSKCLTMHGLWPQARLTGDNTLTCPIHVCHTCASDNPKDPYMKYNSKLVKCIRCPTAYHSGDYCVAAGKTYLIFWTSCIRIPGRPVHAPRLKIS